MASIRLNESMRAAFVRAVMDDVPTVDYDEKIGKLVRAAALRDTPPEMQKCMKAHPEWFRSRTVFCQYADNVSVHQTEQWVRAFEKAPELAALCAEAKAASDARITLRQNLRAAILMCTTVKQAHEALPEFAKYLPETPAAADRTVPVIANLVSDLTAAGWPKDQKKPKATKNRQPARFRISCVMSAAIGLRRNSC